MAKVTFILGFKTDELRNLTLPIEIRKPNSTLIGRTLPSTPVELRDGRYYATATLPGGQQLLEAFEVSGQDLTIELAPELEDQSTNEWQEVSHYLQPQKTATQPEDLGRSAARADMVRTRGLESARAAGDVPSPAPVKAAFRLFSGNPLLGPLALEPQWSGITLHNFEPGRVVHFRIDLHDKPLVAQLIEPGGAFHNTVVPATPYTPALLVFTRRPDGTCRMEVHLEHSTADLLLRYSAASATSSVEEASRPLLRDAERLLSDKTRDPVAAAVAAAAILRFGQLKWLHTWTANLDAWFDWLPDGAALHGEHLARKGKHVEAAVRFCEVPKRGLPFISDALFYTAERLKWYVELKPEHAAGIDQAAARAALDTLLPFAVLAHRKRPLTSYPGIDPRTPSAEVPSVPDMKKEAIELAQWLGEGGARSEAGGLDATQSPAASAVTVTSRA